jgi:hypothetical protein
METFYRRTILTMNHPYIIGIDCGVKTGICIYHKPTKTICKLSSGTLIEVMFSLMYPSVWWDRIIAGQVFMRIEDARQRKWIPKQKTETAERGRREGAGYVKAHCAIWEDFCKRVGIPYELVPPKNNKTKVDAEYFRMLTGYKEKTNNHSRDAAMLVIGY